MKYSIRKATEPDFEKLIVLFAEFALFEKFPERMTNTAERMRKEQDFFHCYIAETAEKEIVGYMIFFHFYLSWTGKSLYMDDLYVKETHRGNEIGTRLINKAIEFAKETECHKLRWQVSEWNKNAIRFYQQIGAYIDEDERNCTLEF